MAEAIGLASSILGLAVFAYDTSKSLYEAISSYKSQRKTIRDLQTDISSLVTILESIQTQARDSQDDKRLKPLQQPLECCLETCQEMRKALDMCTKHSGEGQNSIQDWLKMRYHEKSFEDMKQRLASYKSTLSITFDAINIRVQCSTEDSLNDLKDSIQGTKEDLEDQLDQVRETISSADVSVQGVLQADQTHLQKSLESLERAQWVISTTQPQVIIKSNRAVQGSRAIFGTDVSQPEFSMNVSGNEAGLGAVVSAGVHSPETLQKLLGDSRTQNFALLLQALQTQPQSTNASALQNLLHNLQLGPPEGNHASNLGISENSNPEVLSRHPYDPSGQYMGR
ncbi:hypothetical protein ASPWEDRAFT_30519 [Aspergillus wentii DTO 134E9]|uniref:Azaphilone pigments biosynthesis cluster protein L N-terminal domain-containing protein n=1 Tax=Aspergillus wentii DTO 134E9 TaxID=1073089 RepID=A0A1L9REZ9_ASPWE|nr:uncharacterized protein ASPWEDRAFT_30519 [Aspergillus wentii DTO 134E9]OJJ33443.1 hypothetical protein ASPWEDRAFT_30519 [Aspergillus wentii DTO 134E9]